MKLMGCNRRSSFLLSVIFSALIISGCSHDNGELPAIGQDDNKISVDWLLYEEEEQGTGKYPVRILVGKNFVRFDDNFDASDFLLLDRQTQALYSVSHEERSILVIESKPGDFSLPPGIILTEERSEDGDAPAIGGILPVHVRFRANQELCYEAVVVPGLLDRVTSTLTDYAKTLGRRQFNSMESVPAEMQTPCFLSRYVYKPARHYAEGLPVREWDTAGYSRTLMDYGERLEVSPALFVLPVDYERFRMD